MTRAGDLVKVRIQGSDLCNKVAILLELSAPSMMFPYQTATIMLEDGTCHDGIHPSTLEVILPRGRKNGHT